MAVAAGRGGTGRSTSRVRIERVRPTPDRIVENDRVAVEEPLEIRVEVPLREGLREHPVSVTMRTPGDDFELAVGFLVTEGVVTDAAAIRDARYCRDAQPQEYNVVTASLRDPASFDASSLTRNFYVTSSCGVCGKASLEAVEVMGCQPVALGTLRIERSAVFRLPDRLRSAQRVFARTGGAHAAGLFDAAGALSLVREDVGRHNAVDKVVGALALAGDLPAPARGLVVSGRSSFEILQKAAMAGIPMVVAVGAPSSLAVRFARRFRMTLVGFAGERGFNVYADAEGAAARVVDERVRAPGLPTPDRA